MQANKKSLLTPFFQKGGHILHSTFANRRRHHSLSSSFYKRQQGGIYRSSGFTLLEILIAMFIFAILALLLSSALHNIIGIQSRTEHHAEELHDLQLAFLMLSRGVTQAVNRPVIMANGKEEAAFVGRPTSFSLTHTGISNAGGNALHSSLQRVQYFIDGRALWKNTWGVLDQAPQSAPYKRRLLKELDEATFEYLDSQNVFHPEWPAQGIKEVLPRAVRIHLTISNGGKISQLYPIPVQVTSATNIIRSATDADKTSDKQ